MQIEKWKEFLLHSKYRYWYWAGIVFGLGLIFGVFSLSISFSIGDHELINLNL